MKKRGRSLCDLQHGLEYLREGCVGLMASQEQQQAALAVVVGTAACNSLSAHLLPCPCVLLREGASKSNIWTEEEGSA